MLLPSPLLAGEIYKWVDDKGAIHFTDNSSKVPTEYQGKTDTTATPLTREEQRSKEQEERSKQWDKEREERLKQKQQELEDRIVKKIKNKIDEIAVAFLFGTKPKKSLRDGSYSSIKNHLKSIAHDPDSITISGCTEVYYTNKGWLIGCNFRGKNAFGALIHISKWFTILNLKVVKVEPASSYTP
jgi:hypothetical protein